ncbi:hypothetical protein HJC23_003801 [Cyclotella cryptica]|uniref:VWFA domain-containing protein n=1 Tax=Cyclotella cryptica TaxID=29204 RepID=A0ABD3Q0Y9_9STRA
MTQLMRFVRMTQLLAAVFLVILLQTVRSAGGQKWFTSTRLVKDPNDSSGGIPVYSDSENNYFVGTVVNKTRLFDLSVSLYNNPSGDDNGNTQDSDDGSAEQDKIEKVFQFMADAIYDATEGGHTLGQVRIFRNKKRWDLADIRWDAIGHPCAYPNGIHDFGVGIFMYDIFRNDENGEIITEYITTDDESADLIGAGYTLAHEFGHYAYGLGDEYSLKRGDVDVEPSIMNCQMCARDDATHDLSDASWLQFSIKHQGNPPGPYQDTLQTDQHRTHGESCWETLSRTNTFIEQLSNHQRGKPLRVVWPELTEVAPTGTNTPSLMHLPEKARSHLEIIWMADMTISVIVIDSSGSMSGNKISNAKTAAKLLIDLAEVGSFIGIIQFSDSATVVVPISEITDQASKEEIKTAIDKKISAGGNTYMGSAAKTALDTLLDYSTGVQEGNKVVFLLSDGKSGDDAFAPIPAYQVAKIPIFTFSYGTGADTNTLGTMASLTRGKLYISPTTLVAITRTFQDANAIAAGTSNVASGSSTVRSGGTQIVEVTVDSTLDTISLTVTYHGHSSDLLVELFDPVNFLSNPLSPNVVTESGGETLVFFYVTDPTPGNWLIKSTSSLSLDVPFEFILSGTQSGAGYVLTGGVSDRIFDIKYPEPFILRSSLFKELPIINAVVEALITAPDGSYITIQMTDDGTPPDNLAGDGEYTGALNYDQSGVYNVLVRARGLAGVAMQDAETLQPSAGPNGEFIPFGPPSFVSDDFERFVRFQIETIGVVSDDHGNTIDNATDLSAQNDILISGRIESGGDVDVFKIVSVPEGLAELVIRVSNRAFGMIPVLKIFNEMRVIVEEGTLDVSQSMAGLLSLIIPVPGNKTYFAEVSHQDDISGTGYYQISAGGVLTQFDLPLPPSTPSPSTPSPSTTLPTVKPTQSKKIKKTKKSKARKSEKKSSHKSEKLNSSKPDKHSSSKTKQQPSGKSSK